MLKNSDLALEHSNMLFDSYSIRSKNREARAPEVTIVTLF